MREFVEADRRPNEHGRRIESVACLEDEASTEADTSLAAGRAGDLAERRAGRDAVAGVRVAPADRVGHVVSVHAELGEAAAAHGETLEQRTIELPEAWT